MRKTSEKINIFRNLFVGLPNVYGTYDLSSGKARQVKASVTNEVFLKHLQGYQPYGVYLLVNDRTRAVVVDFDSANKMWPFEFLSSADHYGIEAYIECSKSKGFHVWIFFNNNGVPAFKARVVAQHILNEIEQPSTEIFPKQDRLDTNIQYGNFIYAPLFGALVPRGKTVFVDPGTYKPYQDQWSFLKSVKKSDEAILDEIIELNNLEVDPPINCTNPTKLTKNIANAFGLPLCAQVMFQDGVSKNQRCACFRLAVHLKRLGFPLDGAIALLVHWSHKNKPANRKKMVITEKEIVAQASYAFQRNYTAYGCESDEVKPYCQPECPVNLARSRMSIRRQP